MIQIDLGPHHGKPLEMQIDGSCPNGTTSRQGNSRFFHSGDQRSQNKNGSTHFPNQIIRCFELIKPSSIDSYRIAILFNPGA